jgi:hypothetical protein
MTLSCTEAKYVAVFEAVKEVKFVYYLLCDLQIKVKFPIVVRMHNIGAIFIRKMLQPAFVLGTWTNVITLFENSLKTVLSKFYSSVQSKMILIYLRRRLVRSYMKDKRRNFGTTVEITVLVDCYRIGRMLKISFMTNHLFLHVGDYPLGIKGMKRVILIS